MGEDGAVLLAKHLLTEALLLCAPTLVAACVVSLACSLLQTLTGVQEQTLTTVPRLVAVFVVAGLTLGWTAHRLSGYTMSLWTDLHRYLS